MTSTGATSVPTRLVMRAEPPCSRPMRAASCGETCSVQRSFPFTSAGRLCMNELLQRMSRRPIRSTPSRRSAMRARSRSRSSTMRCGASSIRPLSVLITSRRCGSSGPEVDPVRRRLQHSPSVRPPGAAAEAVAVRADAQQQVDDARGADPAVDLREDLVDREPGPLRVRRDRSFGHAPEHDVVDRLARQVRDAEHARADLREAPARSRACRRRSARSATTTSRRCAPRAGRDPTS